MSDRYLRQLLRAALAGEIPLTDYIAAALRVMSLEDVLGTLMEFDVADVRQAVKMVWIPAYAAQSKENRNRVGLAGALGDTVSKKVAPARKKDDFTKHEFFDRNRKLLSNVTWRLFAADCAEHVLSYWETNYPNDDRPRHAIETTRRFVLGLATQDELEAARSAAWSAALLAPTWSSLRSAAGSAGLSAETSRESIWTAIRSASWSASRASSCYSARSTEESAAVQVEITWQRNRLIDYLTGLSALPPQS